MHKPQFSSEIGAVLKNATILGVKKKNTGSTPTFRFVCPASAAVFPFSFD